jgi:hypothetical protein
VFDEMDVDEKKIGKKGKPKTKKERRIEKKVKQRRVKSMIAFPVKKKSKRRQPRI